jgi:hypothetical protein
VKKKSFGIIFFLTYDIFNMQHFSSHFNVKNGLISNKFENFKLFVGDPDPLAMGGSATQL